MTLNKNAIKILCLSLILTFAAPAFAQCNLPVCDIPTALQQLQAANQTTRAQTVKDLRIKFRPETDPAIFQNLKE